ncbi:hypothetical protein PPYR_02517 [Photinus pyralis]|uniref:Uncharacterized protein n=2 Tax=Photinus pyralis TaxID=7054 RepID=A0A5N4B7G6_PHOPY|nr:hypothetical protein PPYR_02517 [Photinus pyralis]
MNESLRTENKKQMKWNIKRSKPGFMVPGPPTLFGPVAQTTVVSCTAKPIPLHYPRASDITLAHHIKWKHPKSILSEPTAKVTLSIYTLGKGPTSRDNRIREERESEGGGGGGSSRKGNASAAQSFSKWI